ERGQCELSMTPYAHPLMPLLIDFKSAREAIPTIALPHHERYLGGAERASWHIEHGLEVFSRAFGVRPLGCWPAEGAVSEEGYRLFERCGFRWIASSSGVLRSSLAVSRMQDDDAYHRACTIGGGRLRCFFRDDALSDRIGFTYATWHGDDAARN